MINTFFLTNFFSNIWEKFNDWLSGILKFDHWFDLIADYLKQLPELFKWGLLLFTIIILILGIISFIKKLFKLFVILAIIGAIILVIWKT